MTCFPLNYILILRFNVTVDMLFLNSLKRAAIDLHVINHQGPQFQLKILFTVLLKKKVTILDGLRVSKLTANVHCG